MAARKGEKHAALLYQDKPKHRQQACTLKNNMLRLQTRKYGFNDIGAKSDKLRGSLRLEQLSTPPKPRHSDNCSFDPMSGCNDLSFCRNQMGQTTHTSRDIPRNTQTKQTTGRTWSRSTCATTSWSSCSVRAISH